jgi:hypothetical protein
MFSPRGVVQDERRGWWCLATFEALEPSAFAEAPWLDLNDEECADVLYASG